VLHASLLPQLELWLGGFLVFFEQRASKEVYSDAEHACFARDYVEKGWRRKTRNMWVHQINIKRPEFGIFSHLYPDLLEGGEKFHGFFLE